MGTTHRAAADERQQTAGAGRAGAAAMPAAPHEAGAGADTAGEKRAAPAAARVLCVDVGNTVTRFGLFEIATADEKGAGTEAALAPDGDGPALLGSCELTTLAPVTADEALVQIRHALELLGCAAVDGTILSCVVPSVGAAWKRACARCCPARPLVVGPGLKSGIAMRYDDPSEVGSDRVADVVAARAFFGAPAVVVDLGTTTNFEVVDATGAFAGGVIAPGVALGARALAEAAARLPEIELRAPAQVIGRNTRAAMQSGLVLGEVARIDGLLDGILTELAAADPQNGAGAVPVVLTGNDARHMAALLRHHAVVDEALTLRGLALLWRRNQR